MATDPIRALLTRAVAYDAQAAVRPPVADIEDIDGLQAALDGKAAAVHSHIIGDSTGLQDALGGKADAVHSHIIGDVTGLQDALDGKADVEV